MASVFFKNILFFVFGVSVLPALNGQNSDQPNIIFILTDDQRWDALGYAGNNSIKTPEMDKLAEEGCYFANAFVTTPICAASRASIILGQYERTHDYTFGQPPISSEKIDQSYFALLKNVGYYTGFLGKLGMHFQHKADTGLFDVYQPEGAGFYWRLINNFTEHKHLTHIMGERAVDFIEKAPSDKPFCLSISYNAPHAEDRSPDQYIWPRELDTLYQEVTIPDPLLGESEFFEEQPWFVQQGLNRVRWYWRFDTPAKYQEMVKGYYRMITAIDATVGWVREALEEKGVAENTIIMLMGDNGYFLGERQFAGKWLMYDNSLRVPLIIYDPRSGNQKDFNNLALNIDIAPTILDFAGVPVPGSMQGISLAGYIDGKQPDMVRDIFLCEHLWDYKSIPSSEGIRTKTWKYFRYRDYPDHKELYHLPSDPLEIKNLANDPAYADTLLLMEQNLEKMVNRY